MFGNRGSKCLTSLVALDDPTVSLLLRAGLQVKDVIERAHHLRHAQETRLDHGEVHAIHLLKTRFNAALKMADRSRVKIYSRSTPFTL